MSMEHSFDDLIDFRFHFFGEKICFLNPALYKQRNWNRTIHGTSSTLRALNPDNRTDNMSKFPPLLTPHRYSPSPLSQPTHSHLVPNVRKGSIRRSPNFSLETSHAGCQTLHELFFDGPNIEGGGDKPCLGFRANSTAKKDEFSPFVYYSYSEVKSRVLSFAAGLVSIGIKCSDMSSGWPSRSTNSDLSNYNIPLLAIYAKNSPEWMISEQSIFSLGGATVPLYDTLGAESLSHILCETEVGVIVVGGDVEGRKVFECKKAGNLPSLKAVIVVGGGCDAGLVEEGAEAGLRVESFQRVEAIGFDKRFGNDNSNDNGSGNSSSTQSKTTLAFGDFRLPTPSTLATFCYTSGTTGPPKGALITHSNLVSLIHSITSMGFDLNSNDRHMSYLPLAHIFERVVTLGMTAHGGSVSFISGGPDRLVEDWVATRPTIVPVAPRVLNKIYDKINNGLAAQGGTKKTVFDYALRQKRRALEVHNKLTHPVWDKLLFRKISRALGLDCVRIMCSGSAPLSPSVMSFFRCLLSCPIVEGYGQTEGTGGASISSPDDQKTLGHVGGPITCAEVRLVDVPEMEYTNKDRSHRGQDCVGRGEIWIRGPTVFQGYYKNKEKTDECLTGDGWLQSGDIGLWRPDGQLQIIDRKKNIFKLSQGEYVAAEKIENVHVGSPFVEQSFVYGDSLQSHLVAIIVIDKEFIKSKNSELLTKLAELKETVMTDIAKVGKAAGLNGFEMVRNVHIEEVPFSAENGLVTPTFKLKRHQLKQRYQKEIDAMYANSKL